MIAHLLSCAKIDAQLPLLRMAKQKMPESQKHGFDIERIILRDVFKVAEGTRISYTSKDDLPCGLNSLNPGEAISIKTTMSKSVDMGNPFSIFSCETPTTLIVVRLRQTSPTTKTIESVTEIDLLRAKSYLFGTVSQADLDDLNAATKAIPPGRQPAAIKAPAHAKKEALNAASGAIAFRVKVDSKTQRRIQCSFPDFPAFCAAHPDVVLSHSATPSLRGCALPLTITSPPRQRAKRSAPSSPHPLTDSAGQSYLTGKDATSGPE